MTVSENSDILYLTNDYKGVKMMGTNKITAAVIALVAICIASFVVVRQLTKGEQINNPTIIANNQSVEQQTQTSSSQNAVSTVAPITTLAPTTTLPITTVTQVSSMPVMSTTIVTPVTSESTEAGSSEEASTSENVFSTYDMSTTAALSQTEMTVPQASSEEQTTQQTETTFVLPPITSATAAPTTTPVSTDPYINQAAQENDGFLGYMYNETGNYYYTNRDPWQRVFGFNAAYDFGAQFVFMFFDTARIKYTYDNKDWMVEFWKGQYGGVFIGAEIGVYYKPVDRTVEHYDSVSDDDALYMEMTLYRNGEELLSREYTRYWWCTGFVPGKLKKYSDRSELTLKSRITMDNKKMLNAFTEGLDTCKEFKFVEGKNYKVDGLDVFINW